MCGVLNIEESEGASGVGGTTAEFLNIRGMDGASSVGGGTTDYLARKEGPSSEVNVGPTEHDYVPVNEATGAGESSDEEQNSIVASVRTQPIGEEAHATQEQYRQAAMNREVPPEAAAAAAPPPTPTELVEVSEGDVGPTIDFSGIDNQGDRAWEAEAREGLTFDTNLASMHSYLGGLGEVDDIGSDHFNAAGGALLRLPMFYLEGIILFPGQKLPLRVLQDRFKAAVTHAMQTEGNDAPYTLGVIHVRVSHNGRIHVANYGTTAKIRKLSDQGDGSINVMTKGKQRFRIYRVMTAPDGALFAEVQIIKDDSENVTRVPRAAFSSMAPVYKRRSGRAKRAPSGLLTVPNWTDGESQAASGEDYYEETEAPERENHLQNHHDCQETNRFDESNEGEEDEVGTVDESGDRAEDADGDESDDFFAAVDEEDGEFSDEDEVGRPYVRQRLDASTSDGASTSVGRRLEELEPLGRQPHEGRNREVRYASEVGDREGRNLEDSEPESSREPLERGNTEAEAAAAIEQAQTLAIVPADEGIGLQQGVWANPHKNWRKDAFRWGMRAQLSAWPHWVYRQYDAYDLAGRAADMLRQTGDHPRMEALVGNPIALSYYIASNMPIQDHTRQELLEIDSTLARLKREIQLLEGMDTLRCNYCHEVIARRSDIFVMSSDGAIGAYVNLHGYVHETLTLSCARGMRIEGPPQTENSWFPGYAWVLAKCRKTQQHMGWRYTAVDPATRPASFWGIRRTQLIGSSETQLNQD